MLVVYDTDWETLIIDADDWQTTRALMQVHCAEHRHGWIGRMLPGLMQEAGLREITVEPRTLMIRDLALAEQMHTLRKTAGFAIAQNRSPRMRSRPGSPTSRTATPKGDSSLP